MKDKSVRQRVVDMFVNVDKEMATELASNVGVEDPSGDHVSTSKSSPAVSQANTTNRPDYLKVAVLIADGFNGKEVDDVLDTLEKNNVFLDFVSETLGPIEGNNGMEIEVNKTFTTTDPTLHDAVFVVGGNPGNSEMFKQDISSFIKDIYKHFKPIGIAKDAHNYWETNDMEELPGVVFAEKGSHFEEEFVDAIATRRFWSR